MPVTVDELGEMILEMQKIHLQLKTAKKCGNCGTMSPKEETECPTCDKAI